MKSNVKQILPLQGKTYSLYAGMTDTSEYYLKVKELADNLLQSYGSDKRLLKFLQDNSKNKRLLKTKSIKTDSQLSEILKRTQQQLSEFTLHADRHLKELPFRSKFDRTLSTTREQYHLYMLEIELTNRINKQDFLNSEIRFAFLPHCLHDLSRQCKSEKDGIDYVCKGCSKICYINSLSKILWDKQIQPYLWREANLKALFKKLMNDNKTISVLGIACIAELISGMRLCREFNVPVIGLPLDANRCIRWMGEFYDTSVNLKELNNLLSDS